MAVSQVHNHPTTQSLSHKLPKRITSDLTRTLEDNPYLKTSQIASGQGLGYHPGSADIATSSYSRLNYHREKTLKESGMNVNGVNVILQMEKIADKIDQKDSETEGSTSISDHYTALGRQIMGYHQTSHTSSK